MKLKVQNGRSLYETLLYLQKKQKKFRLNYCPRVSPHLHVDTFGKQHLWYVFHWYAVEETDSFDHECLYTFIISPNQQLCKRGLKDLTRSTACTISIKTQRELELSFAQEQIKPIIIEIASFDVSKEVHAHHFFSKEIVVSKSCDINVQMLCNFLQVCTRSINLPSIQAKDKLCLKSHRTDVLEFIFLNSNSICLKAHFQTCTLYRIFSENNVYIPAEKAVRTNYEHTTAVNLQHVTQIVRTIQKTSEFVRVLQTADMHLLFVPLLPTTDVRQRYLLPCKHLARSAVKHI